MHLQSSGCQIATVVLEGAEPTLSLEAAEILSGPETQKASVSTESSCSGPGPPQTCISAWCWGPALPWLLLPPRIHCGGRSRTGFCPRDSPCEQTEDWLKTASYWWLTSSLICWWNWLHHIWTVSVHLSPGGDAGFAEHVAAVGQHPKGLVFWEILLPDVLHADGAGDIWRGVPATSSSSTGNTGPLLTEIQH